jgi:hypothetical protein
MFKRSLSLAVLAALLTAPLAAADKNDKNTNPDKNKNVVADKNKNAKPDKNAAKPDKNLKNAQPADKKGQVLPGFNLPKGVELSAEQQEKLKAIKEEVAPKLAEVQKEIDAVLTKERKAAQAAAMQKAKAEGKDKREITEAGQHALGLKDDEAARLKQLGTQRGTILKDVQQKLQALLTDEQKAKLSELKKGKGDKNTKPDKGGAPNKGTQPDKNTKPLKGAAPDKNAKPDKGGTPDNKGAQSDKNAKPLKGAAPDKNKK